MLVFFWAHDLVPLFYISVFMPLPYCFNYCSFEIYFEIKKMQFPAFFYSKIALDLWSLSWFHMNSRIVFPTYVKNVIGNLMRMALNLQIALSNIDILLMFIVLIHEDRMSFIDLCLLKFFPSLFS